MWESFYSLNWSHLNHHHVISSDMLHNDLWMIFSLYQMYLFMVDMSTCHSRKSIELIMAEFHLAAAQGPGNGACWLTGILE